MRNANQHPAVSAAMLLAETHTLKVPLMVEIDAIEAIEVAKLAHLKRITFEEAFNEALSTSATWGSFRDLTQKAIEDAEKEGGAQ